MDVADHTFLDGRLLLREPRTGHRSGTDAILLAAAGYLEPGQHLIDAGSGAGAAALAVLCRIHNVTATLVEYDEDMAALARHNVEANGYASCAEVIRADIFDRHACRAVRPADLVLSNPPFYLEGTVRSSGNPQRARSHVLTGGDHGEWLRRLFALAKPRGRIVVVHRPDALDSLLRAAQGQAAVAIRAVHPKSGKPATRVILTAALGKRTPLSIEPPITLHEETGAFTPHADDLHRGRSWL